MRDDFSWVNQALFSDGGFHNARHGDWYGLPLRGATRRLVPLDRAASQAAFGNRHDAMSRRRLLAASGVGRLLATGLPQRSVRNQIATASALGLSGSVDASLLASLQSWMPATAHVAVTLGPLRYNRKPVVQLIDRNATTIGFAKIGCDSATNDLVRNEADWLQRVDRSDLRLLRVPQLLEFKTWHDRPVAIIEAAPTNDHLPAAVSPARVAAIASELASIGGVASVSVRSSATVSETTELSERFAATPVGERAKAAIASVVGAFGDDLVSVGLGHGDLTPWNMISTADATWLLDWEFAAGAVPIGVDLLHHDVMVATHLGSLSFADAFDRYEPKTDAEVARLGISANAEAVFALYLLDVVRRGLWLMTHHIEPTNAAVAALDRLTDPGRPGTS